MAGVDFIVASMVQIAPAQQSMSSQKGVANSFESTLKSEAEKANAKTEKPDVKAEKPENSEGGEKTETTGKAENSEAANQEAENPSDITDSPEVLEAAAAVIQAPVFFETFVAEPVSVQPVVEEAAVLAVEETAVVTEVSEAGSEFSQNTADMAPKDNGAKPEAEVLPAKSEEPVVVDIKEKFIVQQKTAETANEAVNTEDVKKEAAPVVKQEVKPEAENKIEAPKIIVEDKETETAKPNDSTGENNDISFMFESKPVVEGKVVDTKVGEAVNVNQPDFAEKIGEKIILSKNNEVEIQLEPENLGKIQIKLIFDKGETRISVLCTNSKAMEIMSHNSEGLAAVIENRTGTSTTVEVAQEKDNLYKDDYQEGGNNQPNKENQNEKQRKRNESNPTDFLHQLRLGLI